MWVGAGQVVSSTGLLSSQSLSLQLGAARRETRTLAAVKPSRPTMFRLPNEEKTGRLELPF